MFILHLIVKQQACIALAGHAVWCSLFKKKHLIFSIPTQEGESITDLQKHQDVVFRRLGLPSSTKQFALELADVQDYYSSPSVQNATGKTCLSGL